MITRKECERNENAGERSGRRHTRNLSQDCTAAFKVTELNWAKLNTVASSPPYAHWFLFFTELAFRTGFQKRGCLPLPWEMTSRTVCSHQNKLCFSWPRHTLCDEFYLKEAKSFDRRFYLTEKLKQRTATMLKPDVNYSIVLYVYLCAFMPLHPLKYTHINATSMSLTWKW